MCRSTCEAEHFHTLHMLKQWSYNSMPQYVFYCVYVCLNEKRHTAMLRIVSLIWERVLCGTTGRWPHGLADSDANSCAERRVVSKG
jgi:hypothetical protein